MEVLAIAAIYKGGSYNVGWEFRVSEGVDHQGEAIIKANTFENEPNVGLIFPWKVLQTHTDSFAKLLLLKIGWTSNSVTRTRSLTDT